MRAVFPFPCLLRRSVVHSWATAAMLGLRSLWLQHVHDEADKRVFLCRGRFGNKQGQGSEAGVVDDRSTVSAEQAVVAVQEIHEQEGAATFVAIGKGGFFTKK